MCSAGAAHVAHTLCRPRCTMAPVPGSISCDSVTCGRGGCVRGQSSWLFAVPVEQVAGVRVALFAVSVKQAVGWLGAGRRCSLTGPPTRLGQHALDEGSGGHRALLGHLQQRLERRRARGAVHVRPRVGAACARGRGGEASGRADQRRRLHRLHRLRSCNTRPLLQREAPSGREGEERGKETHPE